MYRPTENNIENWLDTNSVGIFNIDAEKRIGYDMENGGEIEYYPVKNLFSYDSIITQNNVVNRSIGEYMRDRNTDGTLRKIYYTALARERYGLYKTKF